jgi:hypothetical protein
MLVNAVRKKLPDTKTLSPELTTLTTTSINAASYLLAICMGKTISFGLKRTALSWSVEVISPVLARSMIILSEPCTDIISGLLKVKSKLRSRRLLAMMILH